MNNHECLLISNNRGQVGVNALERFQFCMAFSLIYHGMSLVSYKVEKKIPWNALNLIVKKEDKEKCRRKLFIMMTSGFVSFFFFSVLFGGQVQFQISSVKVTACLLTRGLKKTQAQAIFEKSLQRKTSFKEGQVQIPPRQRPCDRCVSLN